MFKSYGKKTVVGTRSGNDISYTCPRNSNKNTIVPQKPNLSHKLTRDETCPQCRNQCTVQTPARN